MKVNMNYWNETDWNKEGSTSPIFVGVAAGAFVMLLILGYISWEYMASNSLKNDIAKLEEQVEKAEIEITPITKKNDFVKYLDSTVFNDLSNREEKRIIWSRGLEKLALIVPTDVTLKGVNIISQKGEINKVDLAKAKSEGKELIPPTIYTMILNGFAQGDVISAEKVIEQFSFDLLSDKGFSTLLDTAELQGFGRNQARNKASGLPFTIVATFKPVE